MYLLFEKKYVEGLSKPLDHPLIAQTKRVLNKYGIDPKDWSVYFTYLTDLLNAKERFSGEELLKRLGAITKSYEIIGANPDVLNEIAYYADVNVDKAYELLDDEDTALAKFMLKTVWQFRDWVDKDSWKSIAEYFNKTPLYAYVKAYVEILKRKPVLFIPFDEGFGSVVHDISGYNNHGTIYGATWQKLKTGKNALYFDGVDDYVEVNSPVIRNITGELTALVWIKRNAEDRRDMVITDLSWNEWGWEIEVYSDNKVYFRISETDVVRVCTSNSLISKYKLYFIAVTFKPSKYMMVYINGVLDNEKTTDVPSQIIPAEQPLYVGRRGGVSKFNGIIAHVSIFNKALTEKEIKKIYETTKVLFD